MSQCQGRAKAFVYSLGLLQELQVRRRGHIAVTTCLTPVSLEKSPPLREPQALHHGSLR